MLVLVLLLSLPFPVLLLFEHAGRKLRLKPGVQLARGHVCQNDFSSVGATRKYTIGHAQPPHPVLEHEHSALLARASPPVCGGAHHLRHLLVGHSALEQRKVPLGRRVA
eukprot:scaffold246181_cov32-Tisochrysis_lutea.AAC.2